MTVKEFDRLCESLGEWLAVHQCDGSLRKTRQWLRRRDFLSLEDNTKLLKQLGGYCDCEVLMNCWQGMDRGVILVAVALIGGSR